jgi:hypothetical protein
MFERVGRLALAFRQDMLAPIAYESPMKSLAAKGFNFLPLGGQVHGFSDVHRRPT